MLVPFVLAATLGQFYLLPRLVGPLEAVVREFTRDLEPVTHLQLALLRAAMPVNDYLIHGNADERREFEQLSHRVQDALEEAAREWPMPGSESVLLESVRAQWASAQLLGQRLLALADPVGDAAAALDMERFDAHVEHAVSALDEAHARFHHALGRNRERAEGARARAMWVSFAAFVAAAATSLFAGLMLARSVTGPVETLRRSATRLARGELSHRVGIDRDDELGQLAAAFNSMAERIEADQVALTELAQRDGLTGLYNHRTFQTLLADEVARARRFERPISLLLLDIDHFKRVNDLHGHQVGDAVLRRLGELLAREARAIDRVCRYGGEEIAIILPETHLDAAATIAERLRATVQARSFDIVDGEPLRVTVSIGVASWPVHADGEQALIAAADSALYCAKHRGRNRVDRHEPRSGFPSAPGCSSPPIRT